ncbi:hypothetical protein NQ317_019942 [Molorchus minor]|uniref:Innexin n=1 Tax=Molorchus minor TaxID=1323400 RepID=A0ABQ9K532_9CUCU|nr:hypothetical protein NQ317_019942 [Molorchus minor]
MCCRMSSSFSTGIKVSIWTVVQTSFHIIWALCGYYFYVCKIKPKHYVLVILYLTYFYNDECGKITLKDDLLVSNKLENAIEKNTVTVKIISNGTDKQDVYYIIQKILDKAVLPNESVAAWRTHIYFNIFICSDAIWIISAFLLFTGTCFQIKKVFVASFLLPVVDSNCLHCLVGRSVSSTFWSGYNKNLRVENYNEFSDLNDHELAHLIPAIPAISLCLLFSRILVIWIFNVVNFYQIMNVAVMAFQDNLDGKNSLHLKKSGRKQNKGRRGDLNMNTSAARIRNWQLFYGATETTSIVSSSSSKSGERNSGSAKSADGDVDPYAIYGSSTESAGNQSDVSRYYHKYSDVDNDIDDGYRNDVSVIGSLNKSSWSYHRPTMEKGSRPDGLSVSANRYGPSRGHNRQSKTIDCEYRVVNRIDKHTYLFRSVLCRWKKSNYLEECDKQSSDVYAALMRTNKFETAVCRSVLIRDECCTLCVVIVLSITPFYALA